MPNRAPRRERWLAHLRWSLGVSLTSRILAVNIIALGLLAGSLFYLDSYRNRLLAERFQLARSETEVAADALAVTNRAQRRALLVRIGEQHKLRLRLYGRDGDLLADSFELAKPSFTFADPASQPWYLQAARSIDRGMDFVLGAAPVADYHEPSDESDSAWPEVAEARTSGATSIRQRQAPDRTPVISAAAPVGTLGQVLMATRNATDITENIRDARQTLAIIVSAATTISVLLSLFLARTIVQPLRMLVRAAVRVRLGRDRAVVVPRLPDRRDEIGLLARAISDMTSALRSRIDAVETFAADVAHELKNPLASLRSALESLERVEQPELRQQLTAIAAHDVLRIDRLVTEIADASRIDAELSRTTFEPVDLLGLIQCLVDARRQRGVNRDCTVTIQHGTDAVWLVPGDAARLERVFENLLDNAVSFSPPRGAIAVKLAHDDDDIVVKVSDEGPGIPFDAREQVFERFHSLRPDNEDFGQHSGLGLAIARTIIEAHDGTLRAHDAPGGGASLEIVLPAWSDGE
ncbi:MAG: stimulus-sensing domain-containing protein [Novosphingobium sp.]